MVSTIANIKRQNLTDDMAKSHIEHILYHKRYRQFHNEFIRETISFYPEVIFNFLKKNSDNLGSKYYQGLYIALMHKYSSSDLSVGSYLLQESKNDYTDNKCLYNNINISSGSSSASLTRLANLNQIFTYHQLNHIKLFDEQQTFTVTNLRAVEQLNEQQSFQSHNQLHKVTVIVTTYNASKTIDACINSLLQQTWLNLEIVVVDDASIDGTLSILQYLNSHYKNLTVIALPQNVGTFAAKSIGAQYATGEFLTCQDSDDWAHPQKIAEQVQPLIEDVSIIATTSYWLRLDHNSQYYSRQLYPFMRQNPASPMFRLQAIKQKTGLWHVVRTGADSELFERLRLIYGRESIAVIRKPLTIASHRPDSLMTSEQFGIYNRTAALSRLDYWEAWRLWHIDTLNKGDNLVMPNLQYQATTTKASFTGIPDSIKVDMQRLRESLTTYKVLSKH